MHFSHCHLSGYSSLSGSCCQHLACTTKGCFSLREILRVARACTMRRTRRYWRPNATGTLTRLAYARAKECGIDTKILLNQANLTIDQIRNAELRLDASNQINFLNLAATAVRDDLFGFHLAQPIDLRELGFLYYVAASSETLDDALLRLTRYSSIVNQGIALRHIEGKLIRIELHYVGISRPGSPPNRIFCSVFDPLVPSTDRYSAGANPRPFYPSP